MNGSNIVFDATLIVNLFNGLNNSLKTEIEILSFPQLNPQDRKVLISMLEATL